MNTPIPENVPCSLSGLAPERIPAILCQDAMVRLGRELEHFKCKLVRPNHTGGQDFRIAGVTFSLPIEFSEASLDSVGDRYIQPAICALVHTIKKDGLNQDTRLGVFQLPFEGEHTWYERCNWPQAGLSIRLYGDHGDQCAGTQTMECELAVGFAVLPGPNISLEITCPS